MHIYGHRGAAGEAPENTLSGIRHLLSLGVTRVEIDLRLSADGEVMVNHDACLRRTSGKPGKLASLSAAAIAHKTAATSHPVPTLAEFLSAAPKLEHIQLEIKSAPVATLTILARRLAEVLMNTSLSLSAFCATSSDPAALSAITRALPQLRRGAVVSDPSLLALVTRQRCTTACIHHPLLNRWLVNRLTQQNVRVSAWTVNHPTDMKRMKSLGCNSIITDYPQRALAVLGA